MIKNNKEVNKKEIYEYLISLEKMENINYKVLFFFRNLEHFLYGKNNCTDEDKIKLSDEFEEKYKLDGVL